MPNKLDDIITELKQVGALIPEKEWGDKCVESHTKMLDSFEDANLLAQSLLFAPSKDWTLSDLAKIDKKIELVNTLEGQGFLPPGTRDDLEPGLQEAKDAINKEDYTTAANRLLKYGKFIKQYLPLWISNCSAVSKGEIIRSIMDGLNLRREFNNTDKVSAWTSIILQLSDNKIITPEEANNLITHYDGY